MAAFQRMHVSHAIHTTMCDYKERVTIRHTHGQKDRQTPDKVIPMCCYALHKRHNKSINFYDKQPVIPVT